METGIVSSKAICALGLVTLVCVTPACGADDETPAAQTRSTTNTSAGDLPNPTIDGEFEIGRAKLVIRCYGKGSPTIVFEAGNDSSGIDQFPLTLTRPLARTNTTCTYDRVGTGRSGPPREARRTIDDVVADLHALLHEAGAHPPYLLVGQSAGGNIAADYAARYRAEVAGLVLLDVGAPTGQLGKEFPGKLAWNGPEHVDWVDADRRHLRRPRSLGDTPVRIVRAAAGDSTARDVSYWLKLGPLARQVTLDGGHDIHEDNPAGVLHQIRATLAAIDARG